MPKSGPYAARRFCQPGGRPDCFEVYDTRTGACESFGMYKYQAEQGARAMNERQARIDAGVCSKCGAAPSENIGPKDTQHMCAACWGELHAWLASVEARGCVGSGAID